MYCVTNAYLMYGIELKGWDSNNEDDCYPSQFDRKIENFKKKYPELFKRIKFKMIIKGDEYQYYLVVKSSIVKSDNFVSFNVYPSKMLIKEWIYREYIDKAMKRLNVSSEPNWILISEGYNST